MSEPQTSLAKDAPFPRRVALLAGACAAALAASVLAGWLFDIGWLRSALPTGVAMKANAALGMLLCGVGLVLLASSREVPVARMGAAAMAAVAALVGALTLGQDLSGLDLGIDQLLFPDRTDTARTAVPGRMSPPAAFLLLLTGIGVALASRPVGARLRHPAVAGLGAVVVLVGALALAGQVVDALLQFRFLGYARIAAYASFGFGLLGVGLLALVRSEGELRWSLDVATTAGFVVGAAAMVFTAGITFQYTSLLRADDERVDLVQETLGEIRQLGAVLADFTISAGRYIITRDERTLLGRERTKAQVVEGLARLKTLTAGRSEQQQRVERIRSLHQRRVAMSEEIIANVRAQVREATMPKTGDPSPLGQVYPALGLEVDALVRELEDEEHRLLAELRAQAAITSRHTFLLLPLAVFMSLALLSLSLFYLNAAAAARLRYQEALVRRGQRLALLHDIDQAIITARTPAQVAEAVLPRLRDLLGLPRVIVNLFDLDKGEAEWLAAVGRRRSRIGPGVRYSISLMGDLEGLKRGEMQLIDVGALAQNEEARALLSSGVRWYMVAPMRVGDTLVGGLSFGGASRDFPHEQVEIAKEVAMQLAVALSQARLSEHVRQSDARFQLVFENVPVGISMTTMDGRLLSANPALARILGHASAEAAIAALGGHVVDVYAEPSAREAYLRILRRDGVVANFETQFLRADGSRVWVSMSGRMVGDATATDSRLVTMVDDIEQRRAQEKRIARLSRMKDMRSGINAAVTRIRERQPLLEELCRIAVAPGGMRAAWVAWHDVPARRMVPVARAGALNGYLELVSLPTNLPAEAQTGVTVRVLRNGASVVTNNTRTVDAVRHRDAALERGFHSAMHLPLKIGGETEGVLILYAAERGFFDDDERRLLDELAADISLALDSMQKSARLDYLAYYDPLTGLPNRTLFHDRLAHSLRQRGGDARLVAVILLDLERFRQVNETLGRQVGDELLRGVGERLRQVGESAARIGSDLFGLVLRGARTAAEVNRALEGVRDACFSAPHRAGGEELRIAVRTGVAIHPDDGQDADALMRNAEAALRRSKASAERVVFYAPEMNARVAESLALENRLRSAVEERQFVLHYQPKVSLADGRIVGAEALIRWREPDGTLVPPGQFISLLEEVGLIAEVGRWVVAQTFSDLGAWDKAGARVPRIAVNVSAIQLQARDFVDTLIGEIERGGDMTERLELEITESLLMRNVEDSTRKLTILRGMGATVAIDDFGTGYSSLSYLSRLPVDCLKIDRSFVIGMAGGAQGVNLVSTIIALAHGLKLKVVAEGVETQEQAGLLRELGCDEAQGYLFSRPLPEAEFRALLASGAPLPLPTPAPAPP